MAGDSVVSPMSVAIGCCSSHCHAVGNPGALCWYRRRNCPLGLLCHVCM